VTTRLHQLRLLTSWLIRCGATAGARNVVRIAPRDVARNATTNVVAHRASTLVALRKAKTTSTMKADVLNTALAVFGNHAFRHRRLAACEVVRRPYLEDRYVFPDCDLTNSRAGQDTCFDKHESKSLTSGIS